MCRCPPRWSCLLFLSACLWSSPSSSRRSRSIPVWSCSPGCMVCLRPPFSGSYIKLSLLKRYKLYSLSTDYRKNATIKRGAVRHVWRNNSNEEGFCISSITVCIKKLLHGNNSITQSSPQWNETARLMSGCMFPLLQRYRCCWVKQHLLRRNLLSGFVVQTGLLNFCSSIRSIYCPQRLCKPVTCQRGS